jgi:pimeloyl-ACP methyl ester carboxylesterase
MSEPELAHFDVGGRSIAYRLRRRNVPTLVFLPGYASDMDGTKAVALDAFARARGLSMLRFDYSGTGSSAGSFEDRTLALWLEEAVAAVDQLTNGPLILAGSSMGGWLALHVTLLRAERVMAVVGIAAAADFTDWGFSHEQKRTMAEEGLIQLANPYGPEPQLFTRALWESGERLRLLGGEIAIDCPVRLVHGNDDGEVPMEVALRTMRALRSADVQLLTIKGAGHRLSEPHQIEAILGTVAALLEPCR